MEDILFMLVAAMWLIAIIAKIVRLAAMAITYKINKAKRKGAIYV